MAESTTKKEPKKANINRKLLGKTLMYPNALTSIPYASYFKITRWEYKEALEKAAQEHGHRDAAALLGKGQGKVLNDAINSTTQGVFDGVNKRMEDTLKNDKTINDAFRKQFKPGMFNRNKENLEAMNKAKKEHNYEGIVPKEGIKLQDGTQIDSATDLAEIRKDAERHAKALQSCYYLPIPNEYAYGYSAKWDNSIKLGAMARVLDDAGSGMAQMLTTGAASGSAETMSQATDIFTKAVGEGSGADIGAVAKAFGSGAVDPFDIGTKDVFKPKNLIGMAGLAPNENAIQLFTKMDNRSFEMTFELLARNKDEAKLIDELINNFKTGMHPYANKSGTGGVLGFPDVFVIEPQFNEYKDGEAVPIPHPQMPKTKLCALTNIKVNASPANNFTSTITGNIPLQQFTLNFSETTALTQMDFESGVY